MHLPPANGFRKAEEIHALFSSPSLLLFPVCRLRRLDDVQFGGTRKGPGLGK